MAFDLKLEWQGTLLTDIREVSALLFPFSQAVAGEPLTGAYLDSYFQFSNLEMGSYLLSLRYQLKAETFDSFYFLIDVPDITLIKLNVLPEGAQIDQMGFLNSQQEFVDMLMYEGRKPYLTRSTQGAELLQSLSEFFAHEFSRQEPQHAKQVVHEQVGDLGVAYPQLTQLWAWQVKALVRPTLLAQTTAEWKAILMQQVRNDLLLMDNEALYEALAEEMELAQQSERVNELLALMEWEHENQTWSDYAGFIQALTGKQMIKLKTGKFN